MKSPKKTYGHQIQDPSYITYDVLSARTSLSRRHWERLVSRGLVPGVVRIGHSIRFNWPIVKAWLDEMGNG